LPVQSPISPFPVKRLTSFYPRATLSFELSAEEPAPQVESATFAPGEDWASTPLDVSATNPHCGDFDDRGTLTLAVQSKVVSAIANDKAATFDYWCAPGDISYWLEGNIPVVLIVSSGDAKEVAEMQKSNIRYSHRHDSRLD
jgi:hypothetical protein